MWQHVQVGDTVLVDYGAVSFTVTDIKTRCIVTRVNNSNWLGSRKHAVVRTQKALQNFRSTLLSYQDTEDIAFALKHNVDFIALSYTRTGADLEEVRQLPGIVESNVKLLAKIDTKYAIEHFDDILGAADGIVVCRSDIAVEMPIAEVATIQKQLIKKCNHAGKPVIIINHILASMVTQPVPTRAEATDIANMVIDGADCLAVTTPTASGMYAVQTVEILGRIAREAERTLDYRGLYVEMRSHQLKLGSVGLAHSLASSTVKTAWDVEASLLVVFTASGDAARNVAKYRPYAPLVVVTDSEKVARQILLVRGCEPVVVGSMSNFEAVTEHVTNRMRAANLLHSGDRVVFTSGVLESAPGTHVLSVNEVV